LSVSCSVFSRALLSVVTNTWLVYFNKTEKSFADNGLNLMVRSEE
jgi:hypothetical protein